MIYGVKKFGDVLQHLMEQKNLSARELASRLGFPAKTVNEWVGKGGRMPRNPDHLKKLADFFQVSLHQLLFGEDDPRSLLSEVLNKTEIHTGLYEISIKRIEPKK